MTVHIDANGQTCGARYTVTNRGGLRAVCQRPAGHAGRPHAKRIKRDEDGDGERMFGWGFFGPEGDDEPETTDAMERRSGLERRQ